MAFNTEAERHSTFFPDLTVAFKEKAGGTIDAHRFVTIASDGDVEEAAANATNVHGVLHSNYNGKLTAVAGDYVSVGLLRQTATADVAIVAGQSLKAAGDGKAIQFVDTALSGDTIEDNVGLGFTNQPANDGVEMVSADAGDTTQTVTIYYTRNGQGDTVYTETKTLNGTTQVVFTHTDIQLVLAGEKSAATTGTITVREASGNATIFTLAAATLSSGKIAVTAGQTLAYNVAPTAVADAATTKQVGLIGTDSAGAVQYDSQALVGATPVAFNSTFRTVTFLLVGDLEAARTVTVKVGAEDNQQLYVGYALEAAAAGAQFDAMILPNHTSGGDVALLDGVTAGTVTASKAVVVDANKDIATFRHVTLSGNLVSGTTTLAEADLALVDGLTAGTILASKAATVDANKDVADFRNLSATNLKAGKDAVAGTVTIFPATTLRGSAKFDVTDQTGDTQVTHRTAAMGQATVITTPDPGAAAASVVLTEGAQTINGNKTFGNSIIRASQEYQLSGPPKVGATAGWTVNAGANIYEATLPAAQTNSTLVVPINGLKIGWTITAYKVVAQIESAGNTATLDADLRKQTNAAGDPVDASVGTITQVSVTADTAVAAAKTGLAEVVAADEWFYVLITGTTAAATDVRFLGITVTVTEA